MVAAAAYRTRRVFFIIVVIYKYMQVAVLVDRAVVADGVICGGRWPVVERICPHGGA
jgi:hypothetical protein